MSREVPKDEHPCFTAGRQAFLDGKKLKDNPHRVYKWKQKWNKGWLFQQKAELLNQKGMGS